MDKQPPQVIKTQSKFSTTVRYLLGEKVAPGKAVVLKAQIINEQQARYLSNAHRWVPNTGRVWETSRTVRCRSERENISGRTGSSFDFVLLGRNLMRWGSVTAWRNVWSWSYYTYLQRSSERKETSAGPLSTAASFCVFLIKQNQETHSLRCKCPQDWNVLLNAAIMSGNWSITRRSSNTSQPARAHVPPSGIWYVMRLRFPPRYDLLCAFIILKLLFPWFPWQSIKKIKRADRKGSESVTEEKFALLFSSEITITGCDTPYRIQVCPSRGLVRGSGLHDKSFLWFFSSIFQNCEYVAAFVVVRIKVLENDGRSCCRKSPATHTHSRT